MDMTFTGRGLHVTDQIRGLAEQKLAPLAGSSPEPPRLDVEVINETPPAARRPQTGRGLFADPAKDLPCACRS